jgi:putative hydrolase of the HAD superfamily
MEYKRPEFVYFDLGNVLLFFDHGIALRRMAKLAGVPYDRMRSIVMDSNLQLEYETGLISGADFVDRIAASVGKVLDTDEMLQAAADMFVPNPHILPVLEKVRTMGIPIGLLSNTCEAHWKLILELSYPQVRDWFSPIILSYEVRSMKPDPGIYLEAQKRSGYPHESIFFTDDRDDNVAAARALGWHAEVFVNADRLMQSVERWQS